jgi:hypothetical protein
MHPPGLGCAPTRYTAVVQPTSLRTASLLPEAVTQRPQLLAPVVMLKMILVEQLAVSILYADNCYQ